MWRKRSNEGRAGGLMEREPEARSAKGPIKVLIDAFHAVDRQTRRLEAALVQS